MAWLLNKLCRWWAYISGKPRRWWAYNGAELLIFVILASLPVMLDKLEVFRPEEQCSLEERTESSGVLSLPFPYRWFSNPGFVEHDANAVQLVTYTEKDAGGEFVNESCRRR